MNDGLENWLEVATKNLNTISQQQIRVEIETHVQDAVNAHVSAGQNLEQAMQNAILELGDPTQANQQFQHNHLTRTELARLEKLFGQHWVHAILISSLAVLLHLQGSPWLGASYLALGFELFMRVWIMRHRRWIRAALMLRPVLLALVFAGFGMHSSTTRHNNVGMLLAVGASWLLVSLWWWHNYAGIYRKLTLHRS